MDPDAVSGPTAQQLWAEFDRIERLGWAGKTLLARWIAATPDRDRAGARTRPVNGGKRVPGVSAKDLDATCGSTESRAQAFWKAHDSSGDWSALDRRSV